MNDDGNDDDNDDGESRSDDDRTLIMGDPKHGGMSQALPLPSADIYQACRGEAVCRDFIFRVRWALGVPPASSERS